MQRGSEDGFAAPAMKTASAVPISSMAEALTSPGVWPKSDGSLCCGCSNHYTLGGGRPESQNAEMRGAQSEESDREKRQPRNTEKIRIWATRRRCERPSSQPGPEPCEARPAVRFHHLFPAPKSCLQRPITCTTSLSGWVQAAGPVCVSLRAALSQCSRVIESFPFS